MQLKAKSFIVPIAAILLLAQLIRPGKNQSNQHPAPVLERYPASEMVKNTLQKACNDCHSNYTIYPWYAEIQPVASWLAHHVEEGKEHLNFSDFTNGSAKKQAHKMEEIIEMVEKNEMPLSSYTLVHRDAILSAEEKTALIDWARNAMQSIQAPTESGQETEENNK